jgi:hypothetical protein
LPLLLLYSKCRTLTPTPGRLPTLPPSDISSRTSRRSSTASRTSTKCRMNQGMSFVQYFWTNNLSSNHAGSLIGASISHKLRSTYLRNSRKPHSWINKSSRNSSPPPREAATTTCRTPTSGSPTANCNKTTASSSINASASGNCAKYRIHRTCPSAKRSKGKDKPTYSCNWRETTNP